MASYPDLHQYLSQLEQRRPEAVLRVSEPLKIEYEVTSLQYQLDAQKKYPVLIIEKPVLMNGDISRFPLVVNLTASRTLCAEALGLDPRRIAQDYAARLARRIDPVMVAPTEAPVKQVVETGEAVDLTRFPFTVHSVLDPGPYICAGYVTTVDPDTGIDNCSLQRIWIKGKNRTGFWPAISSHNYYNLQKWWARGQDMPVAVWLGHHPAALAGAQARLAYPESHYPAMGGALDAPVRLVPSQLFGDLIKVPADAELVIEGVVPREVYEAEGPFGEYPGYIGPQRPSPVIEVRCVTYRRDAIIHDIGVGTADHLVMLGNFPLEARIYAVVRQSVPELLNVHVPVSGHRFHVYLQVRKTRPGIGKAAILAALPVDTRLKHAIVVDEDIDIFNDQEVLWAIATRSQWDKDLVVVKGHPVFPLDPTLPAPGTMGTVGGIDATRPVPFAPGMPPQFQYRNQVPPEVNRRVRLEALVDADRLARFPTSF